MKKLVIKFKKIKKKGEELNNKKKVAIWEN